MLSGSGAVLSRYSYTPGGKIELLSPSETLLNHLYQQGWADFKTAFAYDATILRGGAYHDALTNGVLQMNGLAYWADQTAIEIEQISSYHRFVLDVAGGWSTGVGYVTGAFDWVATQFDTAGGWLLNNLGVAGYPGVYYTALASGVTRLAGGLVGLADVPGLIVGTYDAYHAYRDEGLSIFESGFYASPVIGGIGQIGSQLVTGRSYAAHDFGRSLTLTERVTNAAFAVSIVAGGGARLGAARSGSAAAATPPAPRTVPLNVLNNQFRLPGGATNPALAQRFLAFQKYKRGKGLGPADRASRQQFEFFRRGNAGSNGGQFYPRRSPGGRLATLRNEFNSRVRPSYIQAFAGTQRAARMFNPRLLAMMKSTGQLPIGYIVHHIKPLYRGGDNTFHNLRVMQESFHFRHSGRLHNYPTGMNPYGRN